MLELTEHVPAQHVGKENIERHRRRLVLLREIERIVAAHRQQRLEALVAGKIDQGSRIVRIILDDQKNRISGLDVQTIVRNLLERPLRSRRMKRRWLDRGRLACRSVA